MYPTPSANVIFQVIACVLQVLMVVSMGIILLQTGGEQEISWCLLLFFFFLWKHKGAKTVKLWVKLHKTLSPQKTPPRVRGAPWAGPLYYGRNWVNFKR